MEIEWRLPRPELRGVARRFSERRMDLGGTVLTWPVPARPHQILDIHLADPYRVRYEEGPMAYVPETFVVGPQTHRRARIHLSGRIHVFNILFQPAGLHRMVGLDMTSLINQAVAAPDILGKSAVALADAVRRATDFPSRVEAAERWIGAGLDGRGSGDAIGHAARVLMDMRGPARIGNLVSRSDYSARQFQRRFSAQVGMTPKLFARTVRFDRALVARRDAPNRPWTDIVHELGYFDQAHFIRDCHAFAGLPPSGFVGDWDNIFFPNG